MSLFSNLFIHFTLEKKKKKNISLKLGEFPLLDYNDRIKKRQIKYEMQTKINIFYGKKLYISKVPIPTHTPSHSHLHTHIFTLTSSHSHFHTHIFFFFFFFFFDGKYSHLHTHTFHSHSHLHLHLH